MTGSGGTAAGNAGSGGTTGGGGSAGGASGSGGATVMFQGCIVIGGAGDRATISQRDVVQGNCLQFQYNNIAPKQAAGLTLPQGWGNGAGLAFADAACSGTAKTPMAVTGTVAWVTTPTGGTLNKVNVDLTFVWPAGSVPERSTLRVNDLPMGCP